MAGAGKIEKELRGRPEWEVGSGKWERIKIERE